MNAGKKQNELSKSPTEHVSFRIRRDVLDNLKSISKEEKLSLNTYVNQVFDSHLSWDRHAPEVGWVIMLKSALKQIIKKLDADEIIEIAKEAAETGAKEISLAMRGRYGINQWISILKDRAKSSGFSIKEYHDEGMARLVLHHEMGENWSIFFESYYNTVFDQLGAIVKTEHTENSVLIEINEKL